MSRHRAARGGAHAPGSSVRAAFVLALLVCLAPLTSAQSVTSDDQPESIYDRIWKVFDWYDNPSNPVVESVALSGRYQHEFVTIDADQGGLDEWNVRRFRVGPRLTLFHTFLVHAEVELNPQEADPLYVRLTDLYVQWRPSGRLAITVGKQGVPFTLDGSTSSRELLTIDRSSVANNMWFPAEYVPGVSVSGTSAPWVYRAGVYSAGAANRELGEFTGSAFVLGVLGYDFAPALGAEEALLTANYVYQDPNENNSFTRPLQHVTSINFRFEVNRWGVWTDLAAASGYLGQSDLWGVVAMPFLDVTGALQVVGRYTYVASDDPNGVRLGTYENDVVSGRGDRYRELYVGANYYFYGHRLKLQSGVQRADMSDRADDGGAYSGTAWTTGLRVGW